MVEPRPVEIEARLAHVVAPGAHHPGRPGQRGDCQCQCGRRAHAGLVRRRMPLRQPGRPSTLRMMFWCTRCRSAALIGCGGAVAIRIDSATSASGGAPDGAETVGAENTSVRLVRGPALLRTKNGTN